VSQSRKSSESCSIAESEGFKSQTKKCPGQKSPGSRAVQKTVTSDTSIKVECARVHQSPRKLTKTFSLPVLQRCDLDTDDSDSATPSPAPSSRSRSTHSGVDVSGASSDSSHSKKASRKSLYPKDFV
jgi:hypothetical protein